MFISQFGVGVKCTDRPEHVVVVVAVRWTSFQIRSIIGAESLLKEGHFVSCVRVCVGGSAPPEFHFRLPTNWMDG